MRGRLLRGGRRTLSSLIREWGSWWEADEERVLILQNFGERIAFVV